MLLNWYYTNMLNAKSGFSTNIIFRLWQYLTYLCNNPIIHFYPKKQKIVMEAMNQRNHTQWNLSKLNLHRTNFCVWFTQVKFTNLSYIRTSKFILYRILVYSWLSLERFQCYITLNWQSMILDIKSYWPEH